jgi:hypothetical protein
LTYRRRNSLHSVSAATINVVVENFISAPSFSSFHKNKFLWILGTGDAELRVSLTSQRFGSLKNYAGFTKILKL